MKRFKLKIGVSPVFEINRENFERETQGRKQYIQVGKDGERRAFAVCPACDNPIQIIGLYKKIEKTDPYGKHYCRSVENIAYHNNQAYKLCPYASNNYTPVSRDIRKDELTGFEIDIYNTAREHFDQAVYILQQDTGIYFSEPLLKDLLSYYSCDGYMYYHATLYNIPWMILYQSHSFNLYGRLIRKDSELSLFLENDDRFVLTDYNETYYKVTTTKWLQSNYWFYDHRRNVVNNEVIETIKAALSVCEDGSEELHIIWETRLIINETRFINLISSKKGNNYRKEKLIQMARSIMPELK